MAHLRPHLGLFVFLAGLIAACGQNPPTGPDPLSEEERLIREIQASGLEECIAEFQRVSPSLPNLSPAQRLAELRRILALCLAPSGPDTGTLEVDVSTTGAELDSDGYTIAVTGQTPQAIGINGSVTFPSVPAGDVQVELQGVAANCTVAGDNPRTVNVQTGWGASDATTSFQVTCVATTPDTGDLEVTTSTTGEDLDPDGYTVAVTGQGSQAIDINDTVTFSNVPAGDHQVELQGVAANCTVTGDNPRTVNVPAAGTGSTTFDVTCADTGGGGASGIIAWVSNQTGGSEIWVMNADGTNPTQITNNDAVDIHPRISTDGQRIVFASDADGDREIYIMNIDGSGVTQLTFNTVRDQEPRLSFDGTKIVFERRVSGVEQVFVMNSDGSGQTQITFETAASQEAAWSPDGTQIVFRSARVGGDEIWVMDSDGSNPVQLTSSAGTNGDPVWFGDIIAFGSNRSGNSEVWVMNEDGSGQTQITNVPGVESGRASFSPDGTRLAIDQGGDIVTIDLDGSNPANLTNSAAADDNPSWGPGSVSP